MADSPVRPLPRLVRIGHLGDRRARMPAGDAVGLRGLGGGRSQ